jgi:hypothetical protein
MTNTWSHLCTTDNTFYTLPLHQECKGCRIDHRVQALRYGAYLPSINKALKVTPLKSKIAALLKPKPNKPTIDEHQESYHDRQG